MILRLIVVTMLVTVTSLAQAAGLPEQFERDANADGALLGMAVFCKYPLTEGQKLKDRMTADALAQAKENGVELSEAEYRMFVFDGYQSTNRFLGSMPSSGENYKRNCEDVAEKIARRMKP